MEIDGFAPVTCSMKHVAGPDQGCPGGHGQRSVEMWTWRAELLLISMNQLPVPQSACVPGD
jgi:hypothetical protein